jgi:hypothetical protein
MNTAKSALDNNYLKPLHLKLLPIPSLLHLLAINTQSSIPIHSTSTIPQAGASTNRPTEWRLFAAYIHSYFLPSQPSPRKMSLLNRERSSS